MTAWSSASAALTDALSDVYLALRGYLGRAFTSDADSPAENERFWMPYPIGGYTLAIQPIAVSVGGRLAGPEGRPYIEDLLDFWRRGCRLGEDFPGGQQPGFPTRSSEVRVVLHVFRMCEGVRGVQSVPNVVLEVTVTEDSRLSARNGAFPWGAATREGCKCADPTPTADLSYQAFVTHFFGRRGCPHLKQQLAGFSHAGCAGADC